MNRNEQLFNRAKAIIPGGVNSPVRAFGSVGGIPRFIKKAEGAYVWDENDMRYIDYVGSWGPAIVGHAHPEVVEAVREAALGGLSFGAPTAAETVMAEERLQRLIVRAAPERLEQIRQLLEAIDVAAPQVWITVAQSANNSFANGGLLQNGQGEQNVGSSQQLLVMSGEKGSITVGEDIPQVQPFWNFANGLGLIAELARSPHRPGRPACPRP